MTPFDSERFPPESYPRPWPDTPAEAGEPLRNDRARSEIHESARAIIKVGTFTEEQEARWREDLGDEAVDKLLEEFAT